MSKKNKNVKTQKIVKEPDEIKKSDFEDDGDNKKILIVILILAILIGGFAYVRSLDNKKDKDNEKKPVEKVEKPEVEETPVVPDSKPEYTYKPVQTVPVVEEVKNIWEVLDGIDSNVEAGSEVELPEVVDGDVKALITYMYRANSNEEFVSVDELDSTKLGEYKVTYTMNYPDGKVESREKVITVTDTIEPVINNVVDGKHYKEDILLDITEYSPYKVELNGSLYDETLPITNEGEYTLVVTEESELASSITVKFVIDKTFPVINFTENGDDTVSIEIIEENIETVLMTKDNIEIEQLDVISEEGKYSVTVIDKAGNETVKEYVIDRTAPVLNVSYSPENNGLTSEKVLVTINSNEELQELAGWTLSSDKLSLTKEYSKNTNEELDVKDVKGNISKVTIVIDYINYEVNYVPTVTIENLITNQVKATITSIKQLVLNEEWIEIIDGETYYYEKLYSENKTELVDYSYEDENGVVTGQVEIKIEGFTIEAFVSYDIDAVTQNVTAYVVTKDEVNEIPSGWVKDDEYMAEDYRYYKVYTENMPYELVEFVTDNNTYTAIIVVDTIDREQPTAEVDVTYVRDEFDEKEKVVVVVSANEEITEVTGWSLSEDKKSILQVIDKPSIVPTEEQNEKVTITDLKGNSIEVDYSYNWN